MFMSEQMATVLRQRISESGMSLHAIAEAAGVPQPRVWAFMQGKDIRLATAQKLADYFGLELDEKRVKRK